MDLKDFRTKYPQYNKVSDATLISRVNARHPGTITVENHPTLSEWKPTAKHVGKYDPRRMLPRYAHLPIDPSKKEKTPSDIARDGADVFFRFQMPESEARERVSLAIKTPKILNVIRDEYPEYDSVDDFTLMEKVADKHPEYSCYLTEMRSRRKDLYKKIDKIEFKKSLGASLDMDEAYINSIVLPEDKGRVVQQGLLGFYDTASFGLNDYVLNRIGYEAPQPETGMEAVSKGVGSLAGYIVGPLEVGSKVVSSIPGLAKVFEPIKASSKMQMALKPLLQSGLSLGAAAATLVPKDAYEKGIIQPGQRVKAFGGGFIFGAPLGALGFIPSRTARMISTSLFMGVPSTLREDSLEEQVFNYGFGAYMGIHGFREKLKRDTELLRIVEHGWDTKKGQDQLFKDVDLLLDEFEGMARSEGKVYKNVLDVGRGRYVPAYKNWRSQTLKRVKVRMKQLKTSKGFQLRNDKISQIFENLKDKPLSKLTDTQLFNLNEHIKPQNTPDAPLDIFLSRPPAKPGIKGKHLTPFHWLARLGYSSLEHLGFGGLMEKGMTGEVFRSDVKASKMLLLHRQLTNRWKAIVGTNPETARRIFLDRDGKLNLKQLTKNHPKYSKEYKTAKQIERYWNVWLDLQNRHRTKFGLKSIKPLKGAYATHTFDAIKVEAQNKKYPYPDFLQDIMEYTIPKKARQPHLEKRRGARGYKENIWAALDVYSFWGTNYVTDDGLRQASRVRDFIGRELRINEKRGKESPIHLLGIKKSLEGWIDRYAGRPGKIDTFIKDSVRSLPESLRPYAMNLEKLSGIWRSILYTGAMGWRPKLALRNLGQHSLIISVVGPKYTWRAIKNRKRPEVRRLWKESQVLATRELGFAPEVPYSAGVSGLERVRRSAFWMFRTADRINVQDAFLAGYYEARGRGLPNKKAIVRGDEVAAITQYMYTKGNRGPISNLWGLSSSAGKVASMFTTWPINKIEFDLMICKPENRKMLVRYLTLVGLMGLTGLASNSKIKTTAYTGWGAEVGLARKLMDGLIDWKFVLKPKLLLGKDVKKGVDDDNLWNIILYDTNKNTPLWERF